MIPVKVKNLFRRRRRSFLKKDLDKFLQNISGVVHVGANTGQERDLYHSLGLIVIWVEPIPEVFAQLKMNISGLKSQLAFQALVTDTDNKEYQFNIADNNGQSSSILELKQHKDIWPEIDYTASIPLTSITLASLFKREQIDASKYQALIMDTQGSELLVLRGALPILHHFEYIKTEVPDFESYVGCCQLEDINEFMNKQGYKEFSRRKFASREGGGSYFDIVYRKEG